MTSVKPLKEVVRKLADTFNNPQNRDSSYFDFYDVLDDSWFPSKSSSQQGRF
ncbi:hypothetical protein BH18THE2_BH18THE2_33510 [soil metagenome]